MFGVNVLVWVWNRGLWHGILRCGCACLPFCLYDQTPKILSYHFTAFLSGAWHQINQLFWMREQYKHEMLSLIHVPVFKPQPGGKVMWTLLQNQNNGFQKYCDLYSNQTLARPFFFIVSSSPFISVVLISSHPCFDHLSLHSSWRAYIEVC